MWNTTVSSKSCIFSKPFRLYEDSGHDIFFKWSSNALDFNVFYFKSWYSCIPVLLDYLFNVKFEYKLSVPLVPFEKISNFT